MDVGTVVADRYEVAGVLARGGMADVLVARDRRLQRDVALKVVRGTATADRVRFSAEMHLLASLQHPHLVRVFDAGVHDDEPFLVLELAEGPTLAHRLCAGALAGPELRRLGRDLAGALAHVHAEGIVHRDVKPANVLTAADGRWLLADFGIARALDATGVTAAGTTVGTPRYLAPEQVTGGSATPAADVYALGILLLEAATGRPAFEGEWADAARARLVADPDLRAAPAAWQGLLSAMTARAPEDRPSAAVVHRHLASASRAGAPRRRRPATRQPAPVRPPADRVRRMAAAGRRRPALGVAAALVLVVLAGFAWLRLGAEDATASPVAIPSTTTTTPAPAPSMVTPVPAPDLTVAAPAEAPAPPTTATTTAPAVAPSPSTTVAPAAGNVTVVACPASPTTTAPAPTTVPVPANEPVSDPATEPTTVPATTTEESPGPGAAAPAASPAGDDGTAGSVERDAGAADADCEAVASGEGALAE